MSHDAASVTGMKDPAKGLCALNEQTDVPIWVSFVASARAITTPEVEEENLGLNNLL